MGIVGEITTKPLQSGRTDATVVINPGKEVKNRQETEAAIVKAFVDLPINLKIIWK
jgi:hypothetical protein